ncbi:MAG: acylphosphatase [Magnetovibrio sp.]|nr:acylphosphatase [Magnetovibrio sp.]
MADDHSQDNVLPFRKPIPVRPARERVRRHQGPKIQYQHHDKVVRLRARGLVQSDVFIRWLVEMATSLHLDGWARLTPDNSMDLLLAGEAGDVHQMLELLHEGPRPIDMLLVKEVILKGDEPMWSGFHHLSPCTT